MERISTTSQSPPATNHLRKNAGLVFAHSLRAPPLEAARWGMPGLRHHCCKGAAERSPFTESNFENPKVSRVIRVTRETHDAPAELGERLTRAGGTNRLGEPNFRVVWGGSRLTWIGGRWADRDESGNLIREVIELRRVPKYMPVDRWHIERWTPPENYGSPEEWYKRTIEVEDGIRVPALGPYPSRGEYEHCFTLGAQNGDFLPLTATACDWVVRAVEWARRQPASALRAAIHAREGRKDRDWDRRADAVLNGF